MAMASEEDHVIPDVPEVVTSRRDFLSLAAGTLGAAGTALAIWPLVDSMNPAADTLALAAIEVDLAPIALGQRITVKWRGRPLFIIHRTDEQIALARRDDSNRELIDPAIDRDRVKRPEWLIVIGVCTHLGCVPLGQKPTAPRGSYGGWFCPCHGSVYDISGRVRRGPAPKNLYLPPYQFLSETKVRIG
jgi:ubiquinol-cytochrome c reductase iron-sulfur subunit